MSSEITPDMIAVSAKIVITALNEMYDQWKAKHGSGLATGVTKDTHLKVIDYIEGSLLKNTAGGC